jgi:hypothetical protein
MSNPRLLLVAVALLGGCPSPLAVEGAPCPCPGGYSCRQNRCVLGPEHDKPVKPPTPDAGPPDSESPEATYCVQPGPVLPRWLDSRAYGNTVQDLLGVAVDASALPPYLGEPQDPRLVSSSTLPEEIAGTYAQLAGTVATRAAADLDRLLPCPPDDGGQSACARQLAERLGTRAFRRPLRPGEADALVAAFEQTRAQDGREAGYQRLVREVLASPQFYARPERGESTGPRPGLLSLSPWEVATRLSYFLWQTMPDDALRAVADAGGLRTKAEVSAQAERLLRSPRTDAMIASFNRQWLGLDRVRDTAKDGGLASFDAPLREALVTSGEATAGMWSRDGDQSSLFGRPLMGNRAMAAFYGLSMPAGDGFEALQPLGTQQRFGILTLPAILGVLADGEDSHPVKRGRFVVDRLLCAEVSPPAGGIIPPLADPKPTSSTRERFAEHAKNPSCWACHKVFDPIGFGLENYDGYGRWRDTQDGQPVDASWAMEDLLGEPFSGPEQLAGLLARSDEVSSCLATQWFRFAMGRLSLETDACTLARLDTAFQRGHRQLLPLLLAIVTSDAFVTRSAP